MSEKGVNILEDKKIKIKPVVRARSFTPKGHDGEFMYTGCAEGFTLPFSNRTGSLANIFKKGEQKAFEEALNLKEGTLTVHDRKNPYWAKMVVSLDKEVLTLDMMNPKHALWVRILRSYKDKIAPSWNLRNSKPSYKWAIVDEDEIIENDSKKALNTLKAMELFGEIKNSQKKMVDVLRLLGKKPKPNATKDFLQAELGKIIAQTERLKSATDLDIYDFIEAASDPQAQERIFVLDAIAAGAIRESGGVFRDAELNTPLGRSMQATVDYFADPAHQEDKILISEKIKRANK